MEKFTVGILVSNHAGVLNRVAGLFAKRCYNIHSLAVGETENPKYSRMTIVTEGDENIKDQVVKQLRKLHDVKMVTVLCEQNAISVEHMLIKLSVSNSLNAEISNFINSFGGKIMDFGADFLTAEITGSGDKISQFITDVTTLKIPILEVCRSGLISMIHGSDNIMSTSALDAEQTV